MEFTLKNASSIQTKQVESTYLDFPFMLKYKSERLNNGRAYLLAGLKLSYDMVQTKVKIDKQDNIELKAFDYHAEVGFGLDCYLEYFKFSPEIKVSYGFRNLIVQDNSIYSSSIEKLKSTIILISFTFE
jgi:hypothetical protein